LGINAPVAIPVPPDAAAPAPRYTDILRFGLTGVVYAVVVVYASRNLLRNALMDADVGLILMANTVLFAASAAPMDPENSAAA
jgi:hypothetical protein